MSYIKVLNRTASCKSHCTMQNNGRCQALTRSYSNDERKGCKCPFYVPGDYKTEDDMHTMRKD